MYPKPSPSHSLERKNNDGNYCPENVKWATRLEQNNNTRANVFIELFGKRMTIAQWSRELGICQDSIRARSKIKNCSREDSLLHFAKRAQYFPTDMPIETEIESEEVA